MRVVGGSWFDDVKPMIFGGGSGQDDGPRGSRCERCPLSRARAGAAVRIKELRAPSELQSHLRELGFAEERVIRLLASHSNVICQVCNARLAISERLAQLILVEPVPAAV